jgi:outer membrane protein assembly factor BamB
MRTMTIRQITTVTLILLAASAGDVVAQLPAVTMPLKDGGTDHWALFGDTLMGVDIDRGMLKMSGRVNAYSLAEGKFLWRTEVDAGYKMNEAGPVLWFQQNRERLVVGTGPISALAPGGLQWVLQCDQFGPVSLAAAVHVKPDRILTFGNNSCKNGYEDDPTVIMIDGTSGKVVWSYKSKGQWFDVAGGYWDRVARFSGGPKKKTLQFRVWPLRNGPNGYASAGEAGAAPDGELEGDRVLLIGEHMEVLNMADGSVVWRSPKKVDRLEGINGPYVFLRDGDKLSAVKAGSGEAGWSMDLDRAGTVLYNGDDLVEQGDTSPLGPNDLLVSEHRFVSRVDLLTGQKKWTVKREGQGWYGTLNALMVVDDNAVTAFDWQTGAQRWQLKEGKFLHAMGDGSQPVMLLVERGKRENGVWSGPFKFFAVDQATGKVVWSRTDLDGKKITDFDFALPGQVRLASEAGKVVNLTIADGSPAVPPASAGQTRFVAYSASAKALQCRNYAGDIVWERKGEVAEKHGVTVRGDAVVWAAKNGEVEIIGLTDGSSRWKAKADGNPNVWVDAAGTRLVVPKGGSVTVVNLKG